jgi:hypothetical protein
MCLDSYLKETKSQLELICKDVNQAPLLPHIMQRLMIYGAHSKINHTHCLMALSPTTMGEVDCILEGTSKKIWNLPNTFPRAGLQAPTDELGLDIPTVWEDCCGFAIRSWIQPLNDEGALRTTA